MTRIRFTEWFLAIVLVVALHGAALTGWVWIAPKGALDQLPGKTPAQGIQPRGGAALDMVVTLIEPDQSPEQASVSRGTVIQRQQTAAAPAPAEPPSILEMPLLEEFPDEEPALEEPASSPADGPVPLPKAKPASAPPQGPPGTPFATEQQVAAARPEQATAAETPDSTAKSVYYRQMIAKIRGARIYPPAARRAGKAGTVYMQIVVRRNGSIASYDIVKSSGHKELDDAAVQTLVDANPLSPFPEEVPGEELKFGVPLHYRF